MANNYFQFKQFTIHQGDTAMKVGTDGVLLGAWAEVSQATRILDVGTGTGLLALMAAQRNVTAFIDAVEINEAAANQAKQNVQNSDWGGRIAVYHTSFQQYVQQCSCVYDVIISNPPYFNNSLKSPENQRTQARHSDVLPYADLLFSAQQVLSITGKLSLILPIVEANIVIQLAEQMGLYCTRKLNVLPNASKPPIRLLFELSNTRQIIDEQIICIEAEGRHQYTSDYKMLTKDFYLKF